MFGYKNKDPREVALLTVITNAHEKLEKNLDKFQDDVSLNLKELRHEIGGVKDSLGKIDGEFTAEIRKLYEVEKSTKKLHERLDEFERQQAAKDASIFELIEDNKRVCKAYSDEKHSQEETSLMVKRQIYIWVLTAALALFMLGLTGWIINTVNTRLPPQQQNKSTP